MAWEGLINLYPPVLQVGICACTTVVVLIARVFFPKEGDSHDQQRAESDTSECSEVLQHLWQVIKSRTGLCLKNSCSPLLPLNPGDLVCHQFCTKWGCIFQLRGSQGDGDKHLGMSTLKYHLEGKGLSQFNSGQNVMVMIWVRWWLKQSRILKQQMSQWQL